MDILIELADLFEVDIRELIDGERKVTKDKTADDTLKKVAEYAENEKKLLARRMLRMTGVSTICLLVYIVIQYTGLVQSMEKLQQISDFAIGLVLAALVLNILYVSGILDKIREWKFGRKR